MHEPEFTYALEGADEQVAYVGNRLAWEREPLFGLHPHDLRQHAYVIGKTGTGKSTLIKNLLLQLIHAGRGVSLLDPHGDLSAELLDQIPPSRSQHVIYFNPSDLDHPPSFNLLAGAEPDSRHLIASGIVAACKSIWRDFFGPRMEFIFYNALAALLECQNVTLLGLPRMLVDESYRAWVVRQVKDPIIRSFWIGEFASYDSRFQREAVSPILNKVGALLASPPIRNVLGQVKSRIDIRFIMDERRIFIANVSKGLLGEDKANLLGALLVTQFQRLAMARAAIPADDRIDHVLAIDEFHNFTTDAFASILAEARKYRLSLLLSNQYLDQIPPEITRAVFGNTGTLVAFRVGEKDAAVLSSEFGGHYDPDLYSNLDNHRIVVKLLSGGRYGNAFLADSLPPLPVHYGRSENLIRLSRERYTTPRRVVEAKINRWLGRRAGG